MSLPLFVCNSLAFTKTFSVMNRQANSVRRTEALHNLYKSFIDIPNPFSDMSCSILLESQAWTRSLHRSLF